MPQFVILRHTLPPQAGRASHFDLMLEDAGQLLTWATAELPTAEPQSAEQLPPHRVDYLHYEGPVSNNRGEVEQVISGTFVWLLRNSNELKVQLQSVELTGELQLIQEAAQHWTVRFERSTS